MSSFVKYGLIGVIIFLTASLATVAGALHFCFNRVISVEKANEILNQSVTELAEGLQAEIAKGERIAEATARLEEKDEERQGQFRQFTRQLGKLKQTNEEVRVVLRTVLPRTSLTGLRSFGEDPGDTNRRGAETSDAPHVDSGKR